MALQTRQEYKPSTASLDYNDHLRQAYWDCHIALNNLGSASLSIPQGGINRFSTVIEYDRFVGCVKICDKMITKNLKDEEFDRAEYKFWHNTYETTEKMFHASLDLYHEITELFVRKGIWKVTSTFLGRL